MVVTTGTGRTITVQTGLDRTDTADEGWEATAALGEVRRLPTRLDTCMRCFQGMDMVGKIKNLWREWGSDKSKVTTKNNPDMEEVLEAEGWKEADVWWMGSVDDDEGVGEGGGEGERDCGEQRRFPEGKARRGQVPAHVIKRGADQEVHRIEVEGRAVRYSKRFWDRVWEAWKKHAAWVNEREKEVGIEHCHKRMKGRQLREMKEAGELDLGEMSSGFEDSDREEEQRLDLHGVMNRISVARMGKKRIRKRRRVRGEAPEDLTRMIYKVMSKLGRQGHKRCKHNGRRKSEVRRVQQPVRMTWVDRQRRKRQRQSTKGGEEVTKPGGGGGKSIGEGQMSGKTKRKSTTKGKKQKRKGSNAGRGGNQGKRSNQGRIPQGHGVRPPEK